MDDAGGSADFRSSTCALFLDAVAAKFISSMFPFDTRRDFKDFSTSAHFAIFELCSLLALCVIFSLK